MKKKRKNLQDLPLLKKEKKKKYEQVGKVVKLYKDVI